MRTINIFVFQEEQKIPEPAVSEGEAEVEKVYLIQVVSYVHNSVICGVINGRFDFIFCHQVVKEEESLPAQVNHLELPLYD